MKIHNSQIITNLNKDNNNLFRVRSIHSSKLRDSGKINTKQYERNFSNFSSCSRIIVKERLSSDSDNLCYEDCPNYGMIKKFEQYVKKLLEANLNLKKINECLIKTLNLKDDILFGVNNQNKNLKIDMNILNKKIGTKRILSSTPYQSRNQYKGFFDMEYNENIKKNSIMREEENHKNKFIKNNKCSINIYKTYLNSDINNSQKNKQDVNLNKVNLKKEDEIFDDFDFSNLNKIKNYSSLVKNIENEIPSKLNLCSNLNNNKNNNNNLPFSASRNSFYEKIFEISTKRKNTTYKNIPKSSLLCLNDESLGKIVSNDIVNNLKRISLNEEKFIEFFRGNTEEKLVNYCDAIQSIIEDLESSLRLIQKLRNYINITSKIGNFTLKDEITNIIIRDACKILDCERTSIFIYDNLSDMLIIHSGEGVTKNEIRINKNKGIIGAVYINGDIIRVDDAYSDSRFSTEQDKKSSFVTKSILAAPLKDVEGVIFGAIQSINKKNGKFTIDDEELIKLFSIHISHIMKNAKCNDENITYIAKLKMLISFRDELEKILNLADFTYLVENILTSVYSSQNSQILIYNSRNENFLKITKYEKLEKNKNIGIIGHVFHKKEYFGINSINGCQYYNNLVDIETGMSLLTYPIIVEGGIKAVLQFSYNEKLLHFKKIKDTDEQIIEYIIKDCEKWFIRNKDILENIFI